ncbi:MAG TPA: hypothetical protein VGM10_32695 [Actinocrinis sp.]
MSVQSTSRGTQATMTDPARWTKPGRLRSVWYRIRFTVQDMNYAARRVVELQAPWRVDRHR